MTYKAILPFLPVRRLPIGTSVYYPWFAKEEYLHHIIKNFQLVVPEVEGKYNYIQEHSFTDIDNLVAWSIQHQKHLHYHTLVWWCSMPPDPIKWLMTVMPRYPSVIDWDVVNEGWGENGPTSDIDVVAIYKEARKIRPTAKLWYNGIFSSDVETQHVTDLVCAGLVDGVGIQMHIGLDWDLSTRLKAIDTVSSTGVKWRISELDIRIPDPPSEIDLDKQFDTYKQIMSLPKKYPGCTNITVWGANDSASWIPFAYPGYGLATPFTYNNLKKPFWY